ncbi:MAG: 30S ribosomal protein S4 [Phycisphaerae bacterium]
MGRDLDPSCRKCRREGIKLMLKGMRCESAKCPMEKQGRSSPPGMHTMPRRRTSAYGVRLREKQKVKRFYGIFEKQFRLYFDRAQHATGNTGEVLLSLLERRLDNVVYKAGFAPSRKAARISIVHGHFALNGRRVDKPSIQVRIGDRIGVKNRERSEKLIRSNLEERTAPVQPWLNVEPKKLEVAVVALPSRDDVQIPVEGSLIVEFCSR